MRSSTVPVKDRGVKFGQGQQLKIKSCGKRHPSCPICRPDLPLVLPKQKLRSCGKKHAYCSQCKPVRSFHKRIHREGCKCPWHRDQTGKKNPAWKGGKYLDWGPGWKEVRQKIWARDRVCRVCGKLPYPKRRLDVHHIISRRDGGSHKDLSNLAGLHHGCHMKVHSGKLVINSV